MRSQTLRLVICGTLYLCPRTACYSANSIEQQLRSNAITFEKTVTSPDHEWELSIHADDDRSFSLMLKSSTLTKKIDSSSKPSFTVYWSDDIRYMVVFAPVGFMTAVKIYSLNKRLGEANEVFASDKVNKRSFVDYGLQRWDSKRGLAVFNVYENTRYLNRPEPRLLATEYVYLDGQNGY